MGAQLTEVNGDETIMFTRVFTTELATEFTELATEFTGDPEADPVTVGASTTLRLLYCTKRLLQELGVLTHFSH